MNPPPKDNKENSEGTTYAPAVLVEPAPTRPRGWQGLIRDIDFGRATLHLLGLARFATGLASAVFSMSKAGGSGTNFAVNSDRDALSSTTV